MGNIEIKAKKNRNTESMQTQTIQRNVEFCIKSYQKANINKNHDDDDGDVSHGRVHKTMWIFCPLTYRIKFIWLAEVFGLICLL